MKAVLASLKEQFPDDVVSTYSTPQGDDFIVVRPEAIRRVCQHCKDDPALGFTMFLSVCGVDRLLLEENRPRFELVYQLRQGQAPWRKLHIKTHVTEEEPNLPSVVSVWKGANWWERYAYDFYGITFAEHPYLKRVLLYDEFKGHPLRKDYPTKGRQPLVAERDIRDIIRGPGAAPPVGK